MKLEWHYSVNHYPHLPFPKSIQLQRRNQSKNMTYYTDTLLDSLGWWWMYAPMLEIGRSAQNKTLTITMPWLKIE
jgi:hypothetical protein